MLVRIKTSFQLSPFSEKKAISTVYLNERLLPLNWVEGRVVLISSTLISVVFCKVSSRRLTGSEMQTPI